MAQEKFQPLSSPDVPPANDLPELSELEILERNEVLPELLTIQKLSAPANFPEHRMTEDSFTEYYGEKMVSTAKIRAQKAKQEHQKESGTLAAVAETIPLLGNTQGFFGENIEANIYSVSRAENYCEPNTDLIFEIKNKPNGELAKKYGDLESVTRFLVDITTADEKKIEEKIIRSERNFEQGRLHDLFFFRSKMNKGLRPGIGNVPNFILPVKVEAMIAFLRKVRPYIDTEKETIADSEKFRDEYREFARVMMEEMYLQALEQTKTFAAECLHQHYMTEEEFAEFEQIINSGSANKAAQMVDRLKRNAERIGKHKILQFFKSLQTLVHSCMTFELIKEQNEKGPASGSGTHA